MAEGAPDFYIRGKTIDLIESVSSIKQMHHLKSRSELFTNPSFETGDFTGWYAAPMMGTLEVTDEKAYDGAYSAKITTTTMPHPQLFQRMPPLAIECIGAVKFYYFADSGALIRIYFAFSDDTLEYHEFTGTGRWEFAVAEPTSTGKRLTHIYLIPQTANQTYYVDLFSSHVKAQIVPFDIRVAELKDRVATSGSIAAADNTAGLTISLNNDWRTLVQFAVIVGGAAEIHMQASPDNTNWFTLWTKSLTAAGNYCDWDFVGFPYFRINVPTAGIDIDIWIQAVKA